MMDKEESLENFLGVQRSMLNRTKAELEASLIEIQGAILNIQMECLLQIGHKPQEMVRDDGSSFTRCAICWAESKGEHDGEDP